METYYAGFVPYDGKVSVLFPDVPGCTTWGDNMEHAFTMAIDALASHLEALANDDDPIPAPSRYEAARDGLRKLYAELGLGDLPEGAMVHPVPAPDLDMRTKQVAVSFRQYALDMIDRKARAAGMTRSGFLVAAASAYNPAAV